MINSYKNSLQITTNTNYLFFFQGSDSAEWNTRSSWGILIWFIQYEPLWFFLCKSSINVKLISSVLFSYSLVDIFNLQFLWISSNNIQQAKGKKQVPNPVLKTINTITQVLFKQEMLISVENNKYNCINNVRSTFLFKLNISHFISVILLNRSFTM